MSKISEIVSGAIGKYAEECDVEIIDVEYKKGFNGMELTIYIDCDREGGISLNDCERFHRAIDPVLDELDPTEGQSYQLNVSSPGLDRPLSCERDYNKNIGKDVNVSLFNKIDDLKKFSAVLKSYDFNKGIVIVEYTDKKKVSKEIHIDMKNIALIKPEIKFE